MSFASPAGVRPGRRPATRSAALPVAWRIVLALTVAGAVLRFWALGHQGLWYDESFTAMLVRLTPGRMIGLIPHTESTPPLYYCVAWVWVRVFGDTPAGLRSLSAVAGTLLIPVAYLAAAQLTGSRRAGVICAALTAVNPLLWWYAQEARSYSLLALLTGVSLWLMARVRPDPSGRRVAAWVLASALALATHYFAAVLVVPEAVVLALAVRRRTVAAGVGVVALCGVALIPLAVSQNGTGNDAWIARTPLHLRLAQVLPQFVLGTDAPDRVVVKLVGLALAALALLGLRVAPRAIRRGAALAAGMAVAGFTIALGLAAVGFDDLITRNLIALWLPVAVAAAGGLADLTRGRGRWLGRLVLAGLCAVGVFAIVGVLADARWQRPEWPRLAAVLGTHPATGDSRLVIIQRYTTTLPLALSLPGLHTLRAGARVSQIDVVAMRSPGQPLCWWGAQCNLASSPLQRRYVIGGFSGRAGYRRVSQFRVQVLRAARPTRVTRGELARALTRTTIASDEIMLQRG